jgi:hypothetical protein
MARCVHRVCGREFGGVTAFDRHLKLLKAAPWIECRDPASVGMVFNGSAWSQVTAFSQSESSAKSAQSATPTANGAI